MGNHYGVTITLDESGYTLTADSVILAAYSENFPGDRKTWMSASETDNKHANRSIELQSKFSAKDASVISHFLRRVLFQSGIEAWVKKSAPTSINLQTQRDRGR